jgi:ABC-type glycerol-3-phosphate transport system substrate-binding protein
MGPNRYVPGNKRWWDLFPAGVRSARWWTTTEGGIWGVPVDWFDTALMVNADVLDKIGVDPHNPWKTWAEMMDVCAKLKAKGYRTPFGGDALWSWWPRGIIGDMIMPRSVFEEADFKHRGIDVGLDDEEQVLAYWRGIYTAYAPWFAEYLKIMKEWAQYFPAGWFNQSFAGQNINYFLRQEEIYI